MKKILLVALPVLAAAALLIPAAFAGPAPKVTADVTFGNQGMSEHWVFNAQDLGNGKAKGSVVDVSPVGTYTANVIKAAVSGNSATFTAKVTSSTNAWILVGDELTWTVYDEGEGSHGTGDWFTYGGQDRGAEHFDGTGDFQYAITAGNIQVH